MAKNIELMGAVFPDVPSILLPQYGGGLVQYDDTTDANAVASDIANGKTAYVNGSKVIGTASGGGGASNLVTGTFKPTSAEKGLVKTMTLDYSGTGYPIALFIFPKDGMFNTSSDIYNRVQRYGILEATYVKNYPLLTPSYTNAGDQDRMGAFVVYSNSSSAIAGNNSSTNSSKTVATFNSTDPAENVFTSARITSAKTLKVRVANTSYGYYDGIEYRYVVVYSS